MFPDLEYVLRKRYSCGVLVRFVAAGFLVFASFPVLKLILQAVIIVPYNAVTRPGMTPRDWGQMFVSMLWEASPYMLLGIFLIVMRRRIVGWLVPMPRPECPHCAYTIAKLTEPRCPECGKRIPADMIQSNEDTNE